MAECWHSALRIIVDLCVGDTTRHHGEPEPANIVAWFIFVSREKLIDTINCQESCNISGFVLAPPPPPPLQALLAQK